MIVTKSWLNEWVDLSDKSADDICLTLNQIGLEVDSVKSYRITKGIVVGFVLSCEKHPDAKKLNVCQVDVGTGIRQIVCGASNVREGIYVPVAMIGAVMPGGLEIKPVKLRGVESDGMICSSSELGLPELCEGILILDDSLGELKAGVSLEDFGVLNDDVIEIELTANRGDCLSHQGVARDLAAAYGKSIKKQELKDSDYRRTGTGRVMHLTHQNDIDADVMYKSFEYEPFEVPLKMRYRLSLVEAEYAHALDAVIQYSTLSTGVILRAYSHKFFANKTEGIAEIGLHTDKHGVAVIEGEKLASQVGIFQVEASKVKKAGGKVILEASYIRPDTIAKQVFEHKLKTDELYYRSSRGSDPEITQGIQYCTNILMQYCGVEIIPGTFEYVTNYTPPVLNLNVCSINALIGDTIEKVLMVKVLNTLGFEIVKSQGDNIVVHPPRFRHDIVNEQDVAEEIVRMVGIDNISSKPLCFVEEPSFNEAYYEYSRRKKLRQYAAATGFFETVSYFFSERALLEQYGYKAVYKKNDLINPIVDTMDTMRTTMHLAHIESASKNMKLGQKSVPLFEYGPIFDPHRNEITVLSFLYSGELERASLANHGRAKMIDFAGFVQKIADVIGHFELEAMPPATHLMHPYQTAKIMIDGKAVGHLFKLHAKVALAYDLEDTFLAQIEVSKLPVKRVQAKAYSKYQAVRRDISVVAPKDFTFQSIEKVILSLDLEALNSMELIDIYSDESLGDKVSVTLRFVLQSLEKTLKDKEINAMMKRIIEALDKELGYTLR